MKFLLLSITLFFAATCIAQGDATITHYQRKWVTDTLQMPCEAFDAQNLLITVPDSVYNQGVITIKKLQYKDTKKLYCSITLTDGKIKKLELAGKGKAINKLLKELYSKNNAIINPCKVISTIHENRRFTKYTISPK